MRLLPIPIRRTGDSLETRSASRIPRQNVAAFEAVAALTDAVCTQHLNAEYAELCRKAAEALARKRPSPLLRGRPETWACGFSYAIGSINFLFDPSQRPHVPAKDLFKLFAVSESATFAKVKVIREVLRMGSLEPRWSLRSRIADNPLAWMIEINGLLVDARDLSHELQKEAYRLGLIPYVPE